MMNAVSIINLYSALPLTACITSAVLALYLIKKNPGGTTNRIFSLMLLIIAVWQFGEYMMAAAPTPESALIWAKLGYAGLVFMPPMYIHFALAYSNEDGISKIFRGRRYLLPALYLIPGAIFLGFLYTDKLIQGVGAHSWGFDVICGPVFPFLSVNFLSYVFGGAAVLFISSYYAGSSRVQDMDALIGTSVLLIPLAVFDFALPAVDVHLPNVTSPLVLLMVGTIAYGSVKHKLMTVLPAYSLTQGESYIFEGEPEPAYELFNNLITHGFKGVCVSPNDPETLREQYGMRHAAIFWLTDAHVGENVLNPSEPERIIEIIEDFAKNHGSNGIVLVDCIDILFTSLNHTDVIRGIQTLKKAAASAGSTLLLVADPHKISREDIKWLSLGMEHYDF